MLLFFGFSLKKLPVVFFCCCCNCDLYAQNNQINLTKCYVFFAINSITFSAVCMNFEYKWRLPLHSRVTWGNWKQFQRNDHIALQTNWNRKKKLLNLSDKLCIYQFSSCTKKRWIGKQVSLVVVIVCHLIELLCARVSAAFFSLENHELMPKNDTRKQHH